MSCDTTQLNTTIETDTQPCLNPSICIPRVFSNISTKMIIDVFQNKLKLGIVTKVDVIHHQVDRHFKKVFVHFKCWYDTDKSNHVRQLINTGNIIKVVYEEPWFWKCSLNRVT